MSDPMSRPEPEPGADRPLTGIPGQAAALEPQTARPEPVTGRPGPGTGKQHAAAGPVEPGAGRATADAGEPGPRPGQPTREGEPPEPGEVSGQGETPGPAEATATAAEGRAESVPDAAPRPLGVGVEPTGHAGVDAQLRRLGDADHLAVPGHLEVYEDVHRGLRDLLTALDRQPGPPPPAASVADGLRRPDNERRS